MRRLFVFSMIAAVLVAIILLSSKQVTVDRSNRVLTSVTKRDRVLPEALVELTKVKIETYRAKAKTQQSKEVDSQSRQFETAKGLIKNFKLLFLDREFIAKQELYDSAFSEMLDQPGVLDTASNILTSPKSFEKVLNGNTALARVYSLKFSHYAAKNGHAEVLKRTFETLLATIIHRGSEVKGQLSDLEELTRQMISVAEREELKDLTAFFLKNGVSESWIMAPSQKAVVEAMFHGSFSGLLSHHYKQAEIDQVLRKTFPVLFE